MSDIEDGHRVLKLLEEISTGDELTQRDLSDRAGIALGLVNTYLKNLASKGFVKISAIPARRYKYYLTPKGFMEKTRLTYAMLQNYTHVFKEARRDFSILFQQLHDEGVSGVIFAGIDDVTEIAYLSLREVGMEFVGAADTEKAGQEFFGKKVMPLDGSVALDSGKIVLTSFNKKDAVYSSLLDMGIDTGRIHSIYPIEGVAKSGNGADRRPKPSDSREI